MYTLNTMKKSFTVRTKWIGLDWIGLASDPLNRTGLDQDHRLTESDWTGFFQMNPFSYSGHRRKNRCEVPKTIAYLCAHNVSYISLPFNSSFQNEVKI